MRHVLKLLSFVPMLAVMYMIWSFSAQDGGDSSGLSLDAGLRIVRLADRLFSAGLSGEEIERYAENLQPFVRKGAHVAEYFLLALSATLPVYVCGFRGLWPFAAMAAFCTGFAGLDEFHQTFIDGRDGTLRDVFIDSAGIFSGILVSVLFRIRRQTVRSGKTPAADEDRRTDRT